jgi:cell division protein FtsQ
MNGPKKIGALLLIAITIGLVFGANAWKSNLKIKQINVDGSKIIGVNEIIQLTRVQLGSLLYKVNLVTIQQNIMSHYYIKDAVVKRSLPNSIDVRVTERVPLAMVNSGEILYLDEDGVVLPRSVSNKQLDLPVLSGVAANENLKLGSSLTQPDVCEALQLLYVMKKVYRTTYHNISEVQLRNGGDIVLYSTEGGIPIIYGRGDMASKLVRLEKFGTTAVITRGPKNLQYIDLRYEDQIVVRWSKESSKAGII